MRVQFGTVQIALNLQYHECYFLQTVPTHAVIIGEPARHYQGCTNSSWCGIGIYMYGGICAIIVVHATHVMWAELGRSHFLYLSAISNVVTIGNWKQALNCFKMEPCALASSLLSMYVCMSLLL